MRKKGHKRLDPKNKEYDRFYVINYLVIFVNYLSSKLKSISVWYKAKKKFQKLFLIGMLLFGMIYTIMESKSRLILS